MNYHFFFQSPKVVFWTNCAFPLNYSFLNCAKVSFALFKAVLPLYFVRYIHSSTSYIIFRTLYLWKCCSYISYATSMAIWSLRQIPVENDKLAISDIGLLRGVWNNFRILTGRVEGPGDFFFFRFFISDRIFSLLLGIYERRNLQTKWLWLRVQLQSLYLGSSDIWSNDVLVLLAFLLFAWQLK